MPALYILNEPDKGRSFELTDDTTYVGRSSENDIQIQDRTVSRKHAKILRKGDKFFIADLKSRNGTFIDALPVEPGQDVEVKEGEPIAIGKSLICLGKGGFHFGRPRN